MTQRIAGEKVFKFNPFTIDEWTNENVAEQYKLLENTIINVDAPLQLANDIDTYANMAYLIGEMIARYYRSVADYDAQLKVMTSNDMYRCRNDWSKTNTDKIPAMSYFEAQTTSKYLDEYKHLSELESRLKRFKFAYDSLDSKMNALKKKLDAIRFEIGAR